MSIEKRLSFKELSEHHDNTLYNSNMANLVPAKKNIDAELRVLEKKKKFLLEHLKEITDFAEGGEDNVLNTTKVSELFNKRQKAVFKNDQW